MSYAPAVPEGASRLVSRVAAIALIPVAVVASRSGQILWLILALAAVCAFESNRYHLPSIARLLSVLAQLGAILGLLMLGATVAFFAESGRQAPVLRGLVLLIVAGIVFVAFSAFMGAVRTLSLSVAEP